MPEYRWKFPDLTDRPDLPALGENAILRVTSWHVAEMETVRQEQPLITVETEDVTLNIDSPVDGRIKHISKLAGQPVQVSEVMAVFELTDQDGSE